MLGRVRLAMLVGVAVIAGCADDRSEPLETTGRSVAVSIDELQRAFDDDDVSGICRLLTKPAMRQAGSFAHATPTTCVRDVEKAIGLIDDSDGWEDDSAPRVIEVTGDRRRRTAAVVTSDGWEAALPFERTAGRWRLDGFFGTSPAHLKRAERAAREKPFPPAHGGRLEVTDSAGTPCPRLTTARFPRVAGGCLMKVSSKKAPIRMLTPFGAFKFSDCSVSYDLRSDGEGRTWVGNWEVEGSRDSGCSDVNQCLVPSTFSYQPWKGRLRATGDGGYVHDMSVCLRTCAGLFVGRIVMRLARDDDGWRLEPTTRGATGFLVDGPLQVGGDGFEVRRA